MAHIEKRGTSYRISVYLGRDKDNKRIYKRTTYTPSETAPTKIEREVQSYAIAFEERVKKGILLDGDSLTFNDFIEQWDKNFAIQNLSISTYECYKSLIRLYLADILGNIKMTKITALHMQNIYNDMFANNKSVGTIQKVHRVASNIFNHAVKWNVIEHNICKNTDLPRKQKKNEIHCFNIEQANTFLRILEEPVTTTYSSHCRTINNTSYSVDEYTETRNIPLQFQIFYEIALLGGLRRGEIISLTWNDINTSNNTISISKSTACVKGNQYVKAPKTAAGYRTITLPRRVFDKLNKWHTEQLHSSLRLGNLWEGYRGKDFDNNFIFIQETGKQMHLSTPTKRFKSILETYNKYVENDDDKLPVIRLHDLRHTSASLLISQNVDIRTISNRLGHSHTSVTLDIYSHAISELDEKASNALDSLINNKLG